ncbi:MAG: hypothetical protein BWY79_01391 [Actinobacteria bacterium ADurb.Bin444]|nr:MAG: hypothetical protein BWY79_01391 [Actinobacteria bacterium ADurb.Bin444]
MVMPRYTEASRAATGMFDVFTTNTVRSMIDRPVCGSTSCGNSLSTSAISLPRSPQPTYTTTSAAACRASDCSITVLPVPNPPGTETEPPSVMGKKKSKTRCPVMKGGPVGSR